MRQLIRVIGGPWWTAMALSYVVASVSLWFADGLYGWYLMIPAVFIVLPSLLYGFGLPAVLMLDALPGDFGPAWSPILTAGYTGILTATALSNFAVFHVVVGALVAAARELGLCRHGRPAAPAPVG